MQLKKRVLLINPAKFDGFTIMRIHAGLCILGGILKDAGHEVHVYDYAYLRHLTGIPRVPTVQELIVQYAPDVIGISVFTYVFDECEQMIAELAKLTDAPIILGGPHFSIFPDDFRDDQRISVIVQREAERHILDIVNQATNNAEKPVFVKCVPPGGDQIPAINLDVAYGHEYLKDFQIQLSRGCPYQCTFCNVQHVAGHNIRKRDILKCVDEIADAKSRCPSITNIAVTDDCPTADMERFKTFLRELTKRNLNLTLWVDNVRANLIDEEMIALYKTAGGRNLCLGVESGNKHVFSLVNKGETLEEIERAVGFIKNAGLALGMCFVIGLPEDTPVRHRDSIRLMRHLKPNYVFWNMCVPWPGTRIHEWFSRNGWIGDPRNFSSLIDPRGNFRTPIASSHDFNVSERITAWLGANLEMQGWLANPKDAPKLFWLSIKHGTLPQFIVYMGRTFMPNFRECLYFAGKALVRKSRRWMRILSRSNSEEGQ